MVCDVEGRRGWRAGATWARRAEEISCAYQVLRRRQQLAPVLTKPLVSSPADIGGWGRV